MVRLYSAGVLGLVALAGVPFMLRVVSQAATGEAPDLWQLLVGASPVYAPAIIIGLLGKRILVFGWYYSEQAERCARDQAEAERRFRDALQAERDRTAAANERAASWERISWEWATTGQSALGAAVQQQQRRLPHGGG